MPYRILDDWIYHVYNRWFEKMRIFDCDRDYVRFLERLEYLLLDHGVGEKPRDLGSSIPGFSIQLHAFCILPNHFHLVISGDISQFPKFLGSLQNSYAKYFNIKHERRGQVFEGRYNAKLIKDAEYLTSCMSYVTYNAIKHELVTDIRDWPWTSYHQILNPGVKASSTPGFHLPQVIPIEGVEMVDYVDIDEE